MKRIAKILLSALSAALLLPCMTRADVTIWIKSNTAPHVYAWNGSTEPLGGFPGSQLSVQDDATGWWLCYLPEVDEVNLILSYGQSGYGNQTDNITGVTGTHYYQYPGSGDNGTYTDLGTDVSSISNPPTGVVINSENFPDPYFRKWLSTYTFVKPYDQAPAVYCDLDGKGTDHLLTASEIASTTKLCLNTSARGNNMLPYLSNGLTQMTDVTGIEHFTSLKALFLAGTNVTTITQLSGHPTLEAFITWGYGHKLSTLDLSGCSSLRYLNFSTNYEGTGLANLNLTGCGALQYLDGHENLLSTIDLSGCTNLTRMDLEKSSRLTELDVANNKKLQTLSIYGGSLQRIRLREDENTTLKWIQMREGSSYSLKQIINLDKQKNLLYLGVKGANLGDMDLTPNLNLQHLYLENCQLTSLKVPNSIVILDCLKNTKLSELDFSGASGLESLNCNNCNLYELDLSKNTQLRTVQCINNHLSGLNLSKNALINNDKQQSRKIFEYTCIGDADVPYFWLDRGTNSFTFHTTYWNKGLDYQNQTRTLEAETGQVPVVENGQKTYKKYYFFRLDDNKTMHEINLTERLAAQNPSGNATFDLSHLNEWTGGCTELNGTSGTSSAPRRAASLVTPDMVVGKILVLDPTSESSTSASGTLTYTYKVQLPSDAPAVDNVTPFTINWTADPQIITSVTDIDVDPATPGSVIYCNPAGQLSETPFEGVNIVVKRYSDGSTQTTKIIK